MSKWIVNIVGDDFLPYPLQDPFPSQVVVFFSLFIYSYYNSIIPQLFYGNLFDFGYYPTEFAESMERGRVKNPQSLNVR